MPQHNYWHQRTDIRLPPKTDDNIQVNERQEEQITHMPKHMKNYL